MGDSRMKILLLFLLSFNCLAQELNECGQTRDEWTFDNVKCLEVKGSQIVESYFNGDIPTLAYDLLTLEQFEEEWEIAE
jgi:hypothetical protein